MTGCDEERERIRQSIAARATRMTDAQHQAARGLQETYKQRRRNYLTELYGKYPYDEPETTQGEAISDDELHPHPADSKLLV
ncbi:MAG: hypothetical protein JO166_10340 [Deltaproteobacteria bacterium]|nr:hypothetical protein [Deltaproteobacteria bacterium]